MNVITFGCRLNSYESDVISGFLDKYKLHNVFVVNTCAVTTEAERQALQKIRKIRRENKDAVIIVSGCAAEVSKEKFLKEDIDYLIGNHQKLLERTYKDIAEHNFPKVSFSELLKTRSLPMNLVYSCNSKIRTFVPIQTGCNYECTFCTVKEARGPAISFTVNHIIDQIKIFAKYYQEIVLTGVNISAFGIDNKEGIFLPDLIKIILEKVPELKFLSLSSLDPFTVRDDLIKLFSNSDRLLPHVHLSIQSGDDTILRYMKRRHTRDYVIHICKKLKAINPDIMIGADIIAGFPYETEQCFDNTLRLISDADLDFLHVFPFSKRPRTEAYSMPNQVDRFTAKLRAKKIRDLGDERLNQKLQTYVGKKIGFFAETDETGRSFNYIEIIHDLKKWKQNEENNFNSIYHGIVKGIDRCKLVVEIC